ncbi:MAG: hypothetical protein FJ388_05185 [Verrucomicrobia bacterium]|nr:hypothetical protein [Verrucomicrobiota bacterium]
MQSSETVLDVHGILDMKTTISRREFLQHSSLVAASLAGVPWLTSAAESSAARRALDLSAVRKPLATFAVITDTHYALPAEGAGEHPYLARVRETMADVKSAGADFIIHLGDVVNSFPGAPQFRAEVALAREQLIALGTPVYAVPGNHDVGNKPSLTAPSEAAHRVRAEWVEQFRQQFKSDYHLIDHAGCRIILLDSMLFNTGLPAEQQQWDRLRGDLDGAKGAKLVLGFHVPLFWCRPDDPGPENYHVIDEPARSQLLELIGRYKVRLVLTGHTHQPVVNTSSQALLLAAPSTTFGCTYGFFPNLPATNTVPGKRGYLTVRVYEDDLLVNRFRPRTVALSEDARVLVARQSAENARCHLATLVIAARRVAGRWSPENVADGKRAATAPGSREEEQIGWSSADAGKADCHEWIRLTFTEPATFDRVVLWPRFQEDGSARDFPTDFVLQATADGKEWATLKQFNGFLPVSNTPVTIAVPSQKALAIAVVASRLPGDAAKGKGFNFQLMEFEVFDGDRPLRPGAAHASSCAGAVGSVRMDDPLLAASDLGARYVRVTGAINTEDFRRAMVTATRLGMRPVLSLPPEPKIVNDAVRALGALAALIEAPDPATFKAAQRVAPDKSRVMIGPVAPDKLADALAVNSIWVSVVLEGQGKTGRDLATQIETIRMAHRKRVFWFDIANGPTDPAEAAQLFLLTYGLGVIVSPLIAIGGEPGSLLDANHDPTPAHTALRTLTTLLAEPMRRTINDQGQLRWLRFESAPRFVEALWTDGSPVRVELGKSRLGATVVALDTGLSRPLPADTQVNVGKLPVLVCKL